MVICLEWGANDLHMVCLMPLPPVISCFIKIQNDSAFLVPAYPGCPGKKLLHGCSRTLHSKVISHWNLISDIAALDGKLFHFSSVVTRNTCFQRLILWLIASCNCVLFSVPAAREQLKKLSVLPTQVLKEYPCLSYWSVYTCYCIVTFVDLYQ